MVPPTDAISTHREQLIRCVRSAAVLSLALGSLSCSAVDVPPSQLSGQWGGEDIDVHDSLAANAVVVRIGCEIMLLPQPIPIDTEGTFAASGTVIVASWEPIDGTPAQVSGKRSGRHLYMQITLDYQDAPPGTVSYVALAGMKPRWSGLDCIE
jgi:hypothetical protein